MWSLSRSDLELWKRCCKGTAVSKSQILLLFSFPFWSANEDKWSFLEPRHVSTRPSVFLRSLHENNCFPAPPDLPASTFITRVCVCVCACVCARVVHLHYYWVQPVAVLEAAWAQSVSGAWWEDSQGATEALRAEDPASRLLVPQLHWSEVAFSRSASAVPNKKKWNKTQKNKTKTLVTAAVALLIKVAAVNGTRLFYWAICTFSAISQTMQHWKCSVWFFQGSPVLQETTLTVYFELRALSRQLPEIFSLKRRRRPWLCIFLFVSRSKSRKNKLLALHCKTTPLWICHWQLKEFLWQSPVKHNFLSQGEQ